MLIISLRWDERIQGDIHGTLDEIVGVDLVSALGKKSIYLIAGQYCRARISLSVLLLTLVPGELASVVSLAIAVGAHGQGLVADLAAGVDDVEVVDGRVGGVVTNGCYSYCEYNGKNIG